MSMQIKDRSKNRQLFINMMASFMTFFVNLAIRFFLTPYIVEELGSEAYGFIGLAGNILSYTGLITIALNSMAGRFVTIEYQRGDIQRANQYYASVFYSNLILAAVILAFSIGCVLLLEYIINIPEHLIFDVKLLFAILAINNIIGLITNIWGTATFIKNRLDLCNIRTIIGQFMNAALLVCLFSLFAPQIWYMGLAGSVATIYYFITNYKFTRILTPELRVKLRNFEWKKVWELVKSGVWNLIGKLGDVLAYGLDLLIANLFLGPVLMGQFALSKNVPSLIISFFGSISNVFNPVLTQMYAQGDIKGFLTETNKTIRILGFFTCIPLVLLYVLGDDFYRLWLPSEDAELLQLITIVGSLELIFSMPLESLWSIFTITNKLKVSTITILINDILVILSVLVAMIITDDEFVRLMVLASTRSLIGIVRSLTFLPMYGANCLGLKKYAFFRPIIKSSICFVISFFICFLLQRMVEISSWLLLILLAFVLVLICTLVSGVIILEKSDRIFIYEKFIKRKK